MLGTYGSPSSLRTSFYFTDWWRRAYSLSDFIKESVRVLAIQYSVKTILTESSRRVTDSRCITLYYLEWIPDLYHSAYGRMWHLVCLIEILHGQILFERKNGAFALLHSVGLANVVSYAYEWGISQAYRTTLAKPTGQYGDNLREFFFFVRLQIHGRVCRKVWFSFLYFF